MNSTLLDRLKGFLLPLATAIPDEHYVVAHLSGVDFDGIFNSPEFEYENAFDVRFGKMMVHATSHLLGGDACGLYGYTELTEFSLLLDRHRVTKRWDDATDLQNYLVGLASARMTLLLEEEALFICRLYAFSNKDLVVAYLSWRQQEAYLNALDGYCRHVLLKGDKPPEVIENLLDDLGPREKEEILRQHEIDYSAVPAWQRCGSAVCLTNGGDISVETNLPRDAAYGEYIQQYLS